MHACAPLQRLVKHFRDTVRPRRHVRVAARVSPEHEEVVMLPNRGTQLGFHLPRYSLLAGQCMTAQLRVDDFVDRVGEVFLILSVDASKSAGGLEEVLVQ